MVQPVTELIHHAYLPPQDFEAPQPGIFKASTVFFPSVAALRSRDWKEKTAYTYGLRGTPTSYTLEERLCSVEGGLYCVLAPSGLAAIATVTLSLLKTGDELLLPENVYAPSGALAEVELAHWGIRHRYYDPMRPEDLVSKISSATRLVWVEAPGSVTLEFPDVVRLVGICKAHSIPVALDNTWGCGLAFKPFDLRPGEGEPLGVDISIQALTKYASGGGDILMGSIITRDRAWHTRIQLTHMRLGLGVGANDVETVLRSLPSMALRYRAHDQATRTLARWCQSRPEFAQVLHPSLPSSPGHGHWAGLCNLPSQVHGAAAGLFSVVLQPHYTQEQADAFCDALRLFRLGYSWGGPVSLVVPYDVSAMRAHWPAQIVRGPLMRFSVGLEAVEDLQADLEQALTTLQ